MKNLINIYNPSMGNEVVTLDELREHIAKRRYNKLHGTGCIKSAQRKVQVWQTEITNQPATSYSSFEIRQFNASKAIEVFNAGGCQKASLI